MARVRARPGPAHYRIAAICALALLLGACAPQREAPLRIGISSWPAYEFLYLAAEKGWFDAAGVPIQIVEFGSLGDTRLAFERGQLDGMASTLIEVVLAASHSRRQLSIVLATDYSGGADVIVGDGSIDGVTGLRGRRVAIEPGALGVYILARALAGAGLSTSDVRVVYLDQSEMNKAMADGTVNAAVTYPPVSVELLQRPGNSVLFSTAELPGEVIDVVSLDSAVVRQQPHIVPALQAVWARALAYAREVPAIALRIMAEREGLTAAEFSVALRGVDLLGADDQAPLLGPEGKVWTTLAASARVMHELGEIDVLPDAHRFRVDPPIRR